MAPAYVEMVTAPQNTLKWDFTCTEDFGFDPNPKLGLTQFSLENTELRILHC